MDRKTPNEGREGKQEGHDQSTSSSNSSDDEQLETSSNPNPIPTEDSANRSINETADFFNIMPVHSELPAPPAPNPMPDAIMDANIHHWVNQLPVQESAGDEHDERNLIVPTAL